MFSIRRVVGTSMLPGLEPGNIVVVRHRVRAIHVGDIVVFSEGGLEKIKRVHKLDAERVYVLGDNLAYSIDSRSFGWIDRRHILGRVVWRR